MAFILKNSSSIVALLSAAALLLSGFYTFGFFLAIDIDLVTALSVSDLIAHGIRGLPFLVAALVVGAVIGAYRSEKRTRLQAIAPSKVVDPTPKVGKVPVNEIDRWVRIRKTLRRQLLFALAAAAISYLVLPKEWLLLAAPAVCGIVLLLFLNFDHEDDLFEFSLGLFLSVQFLCLLAITFSIGAYNGQQRLSNSESRYQIDSVDGGILMGDIVTSTDKGVILVMSDPKQIVFVRWDQVSKLSKRVRSADEVASSYRERLFGLFGIDVSAK